MATAAIIGGGAAGYFAAVLCAGHAPGQQLVLLEGTGEPLAKVRISGGGRCNVTHDCDQARVLVGSYPRGERELLGPFSRFGPRQLVEWFARRGIELKVEPDGRMFPLSDSSETIIDCLRAAARAAGVEERLHAGVRTLTRISGEGSRWHVGGTGGDLTAEVVLLATGSAKGGWRLAEQLGHAIVPPVPSLFTFTCPEPWIRALAGVSVERVRLRLLGLDEDIASEGPLLCTHWGLSGPAVLRASAWGARALHAATYRCRVEIDWLAGEPATAWIDAQRRAHGARLVRTTPHGALPRRLWEALVAAVGLADDRPWSQLTVAERDALATRLNACHVAMTGKGVFKEEFVTAGGVARGEIHWRTMESRRSPGLFFAGECIDVDAITGGFNFQNAWTTGWIAGQAMAERLATSL